RCGLVIQEVDFDVGERRPTRYAILMQSPRMLMDLLRIRLTAGRSPRNVRARVTEIAPPQVSEGPGLALALPHQNWRCDGRLNRRGHLVPLPIAEVNEPNCAIRDKVIDR